MEKPGFHDSVDSARQLVSAARQNRMPEAQAFAEAVRLLEPLVGSGEADVQYLFGISALRPTQNDASLLEKGLEALRDAARAGHVEARTELGLLLADNSVICNAAELEKRLPSFKRDRRQSMFWLTLAARKGNKAAQSSLGLMRLHGNDDVHPDVREAARWWIPLAEAGDDHKLRFEVSSMYRDGVGVQQDLAASYRLVSDSPFLAETGWKHFRGEGTPRDVPAAIAAFEANESSMSSALPVAVIHLLGDDAFRDRQRGKEWLLRATKDMDLAKLLLRALIDGGIMEAPPDYSPDRIAASLETRFEFRPKGREALRNRDAVTLFADAWRGDAESMYQISVLHGALGSGYSSNVTDTARWVRWAAEGGHALAQLDFGQRFLRLGSGVVYDTHTAINWLSRAAAQGVPEAYLTLSYVYDFGWRIRKDSLLADRWMEGFNRLAGDRAETWQQEIDAGSCMPPYV